MTAPILVSTQQGITAISADQANSWVPYCTNLAMLRTFAGGYVYQVYVQGSVAPGDGGQGAFYWNGTSTATDNNSTVIVPNGVTTGAWIRLAFDGSLFVASSSGSPVAPAVQAYQGQVAIGDTAAVTGTGTGGYAIGTSALNSSSGIGNMVFGWSGVVSGAAAHSVVIGNSYASGAESFAAAGGDHTGAYGAQASNSIAIGYQTKVTVQGGAAIGYQSVASGQNAVALGLSLASGTNSFAAAIGSIASGGATATGAIAVGNYATASANYGVAVGGYSNAYNVAQYAYSGYHRALIGDTQGSTYILGGTTTVSGSPVTLFLDGSSAQISIPASQAMSFRVSAVAHDINTVANNATIYSTVNGLVYNNAGTLTLTSPTLAVVNQNSWTITSAGVVFATSGTNLTVSVVAPSSDTVHWSVRLDTVEVVA